MAHIDGKIEAWEERSRQYGASLRGVLFKGIPDIVNEHISRWHTQFILRNIAPRPNLRILDIGCGYGRLTLPIMQQFPLAEVVGIDVSPTFVELFRQTTRQQALLGSVESIPLDIGQFDYVVCVTVLMYVETGHLQQALESLLGILRPEGTLLLIENDFLGAVCSFGWLTRVNTLLRRAPVQVAAHVFRRKMMHTLVHTCHAVIRQKCGLPFTTLCLWPLALIFAYCPQRFLPMALLKMLAWLDDACCFFPLPSLHIGYVIQKASRLQDT